jgi:hypothetical protein
MLQVQYIGQAVLGNHKNSDEIRCREKANAPILTSNIMESNDTEWMENNRNKLLRNARTDLAVAMEKFR